MSEILIFECEGRTHEILLANRPESEILKQLKNWLPSEIDIHCAKIAGCHIYWPCPILAQAEDGTDIHTLSPGAFLYYPERQYLEIIYDELQAETASVTLLGQLTGEIGWLREYATRQRKDAGSRIFTARLYLKDVQQEVPETIPAGITAWDKIRRARMAAWQAMPEEIKGLPSRTGHNIPLGPMVTADNYFRFVQESIWRLWIDPDRFEDTQRRAAAINSLELGISRVGHYCQLDASEAFFHDAISCITAGDIPLQDVLREIVLYCGRMSNWVDLLIPWYPANEITKQIIERPSP